MKKYNSLSELLIGYRQLHDLSQSDLAAKLDVDIRTVLRWEKDETLVKPGKEKDFVQILNIPHQVIRNLNTEYPIAVFYDIKKRTYSLSALMMKADSASWYNSNLPVEDERIHFLSKDTDVEFVTDIQKMNDNKKPIRGELVKEAANLLPELNLVLHDQSGYYAGHITVFPLKYKSYQKIRNREMNEGLLKSTDIAPQLTEQPLVFYFYSMYADTLENAYYLVNRLLSYFKEKKFKDYIFAGITYRENKVNLLREMGLKVIWENNHDHESANSFSFMEGDLDMFLFGKMN